MISWLKKDPLIHGIIALLSILLILIISWVIHSVLQIYDPNFIEFGPQVVLYKAKNCAEIDKLSYSSSPSINNSCYITHWLDGMYKNDTKTLDKIVESAANEQEGLFKPLPALNGYPKKGNEWNCSLDSRLIIDNSKEVVQPALYKCWPK